jgi:hypothetical protein
MKRIALIPLFCIVGCGGSEFGGRWMGNITIAANCRNGSTINDTSNATLTIVQTGPSLTIQSDACPGFAASVDGESATVLKHDCPTRNTNGTSVAYGYSGGSMTVDGDQMQLNLKVVMGVANSFGSTGCSGTESGVLTRIDE